jgi:hypothetical protein
MRLFLAIVISFTVVFEVACAAEAGGAKPTPTVPGNYHQNLEDYRWEVRLVDNGYHKQSFFTDTEPQWLCSAGTAVLRIENFRRADRYGKPMKPEFGPSFDLLPDKDQRLEVIKKY